MSARRRFAAWAGAAALLALGAAASGLAGDPAAAQPTAATAPPALTLRWLGVAGFSLSDGEHVLLHDPYLSRPGLWSTLVRRYRPDAQVLDRMLGPGSPAPELARASLILIGHSHFDHLGDAPEIARRTGALLVGSRTTVNIAHGYGLPAGQARQLDPGERLVHGPFQVEAVRSRHARVILGRVPLPGEVTEPTDGPIHALSFKLGDARGYLVTHRPSGVRLYLLSSAALDPDALHALAPVRVDVLAPSVVGRGPEFTSTLLAALRPRLVIPHHFDDFFRGLDDPDAATPSDPEDLAHFGVEVEGGAAGLGLDARVRVPGLFQAIALAPAAP